MEDKDNQGFEVTEEDFEEVVTKFKNKQTKSYDLLVKADKEYRQSFFLICQKFIES